MSFVTKLKEIGYEPRKYSGRGMNGKECVGVEINGPEDLWEMATWLGQEGIEVLAPKTDQLGRGLIAYWPTLPWDAEETENDDD